MNDNSENNNSKINKNSKNNNTHTNSHANRSSAVPNKMGVKPVPGLVIGMAIPFMLSLLIQSLYGIVDSMYVARIGEEALTATSLTYPFHILVVALGLGIAVGVNAMVSRLLGAGQPEEAGNVATTALIMGFFCWVFFVITTVLFLDPIVRMLTDDPLIREYCQIYLYITMIWSLMQFVTVIVLRFLQASGKMFLSMIPLALGAVVNIILDPIMIFGLLGCPAMGIKGAAIATVIGQFCSGSLALIINHVLNPEVRPQIRNFKWKSEHFISILKIGVPTMITHGMNSVTNFCMNGLLITCSATAVAFFGVYFKLQSFLGMPMSGLGQAAIPVVGYNLGAKNGKRIRQAVLTVLCSAITVAICCTLVVQFFPAQLLGLFNAGDTMLEMGVPALRIISLTFIFSASTTVLGFAVSGLGNAVVNMLGTCLRQLIILLPCAYVLLRIGGIEHVWYAYWIAESIACLVTSLLAVKNVKEKSHFEE